ncbi:MAG: hypothetical protein LBE08_04995 [Bifidobacteriaceae bacterium]|jgi:hypothetical protein|nr:hypothetical protein [Bifidobacteriaceae bacterium]
MVDDSRAAPTISEVVDGARPNSYNVAAAAGAGLARFGRLTEEYARVQDRYRRALEQMLIARMDLTGAEAAIRASGLGFKPVVGNARSFYEKYQHLGLDFLYLRNNLHVERLDDSDRAVFGDLSPDVSQPAPHLETPHELSPLRSEISRGPRVGETRLGCKGFGNPAALVVENTWRRVIRLVDDPAVQITGYDLSGTSNTANEAVVLGLNYLVEFDQRGAFIDRAGDAARLRFLDGFAPELEARFLETWGGPVSILVQRTVISTEE